MLSIGCETLINVMRTQPRSDNLRHMSCLNSSGGQQLLFTRRNLDAQPWFDTLVRTRPSSDANFSEPSSAFDSSQLILLSYNAAFMCLADGVTVVAYGGQGTARPLGIRLASADASKLPLRWSAPARVISSNASATGCIEARDPVLFLLPKEYRSNQNLRCKHCYFLK